MPPDETGPDSSTAQAVAAHAALFDRVAQRATTDRETVPLDADRQLPSRRASFDFFDRWLSDQNIEGRAALDLGCGRGEVAVQLAFAGAVVDGVDISSESLARARALATHEGVAGRITFREADAEKLPFEDDRFDLVVSAGVMSFVRFDHVARELARVVKRDGTVVLLDTLAHNPIARWGRRRRLARGETTAFQVENVLTCSHLDRLRAHFGRVDVRAFDLATVPMIFVEGALTRIHPRLAAVTAPVSAALRAVDRLVLRWRPLRRYAFRVVVILNWPRDPDGRG